MVLSQLKSLLYENIQSLDVFICWFTTRGCCIYWSSAVIWWQCVSTAIKLPHARKKKLMPRVCCRKTVCWRFLVLKPFMLCNTTSYWLIDWFLNVSWAILFSHPADYTPVCTTELGRVAELASEFEKRGVKLFALSCDGVESHKGWIKDIVDYSKSECGESDFPYPIIADEKRELAVKLGMIDPDEKDAQGLPLTARAVSWT